MEHLTVWFGARLNGPKLNKLKSAVYRFDVFYEKGGISVA